MKNDLPKLPEGKPASALLIMLAFVIAFLPSVLAFGMFSFFKGRNVPTMVLVVECLFSLACCSAPSLLLFRRHPVLGVLLAVLFIPLNGIIALFFGCTAMLSAR